MAHQEPLQCGLERRGFRAPGAVAIVPRLMLKRVIEHVARALGLLARVPAHAQPAAFHAGQREVTA